MAINYKYDLQAELTTESIKTDMLNIFIDIFKERNEDLDKEAKDFIVETTEEMLETHGMNTSIEIQHYQLDGDGEGEEDELFVKRDAFDEVLNVFRENMAHMMLNLMSFELSHYLNEKARRK